MNKCLTLLALSGAALLHAADLAGTYRLTNAREAGSELLLKPDGTFEYLFAYGAADYWAKGLWKAGEGSVVLISNPTEDGKPFTLTQSSAVHSAAIRIRVVTRGPNPRPIPNIDVTLITATHRPQARTDSDGIALFEKVPGLEGVEFDIRVYAFQSGMIPLNPAHTAFTFELNGPAITEVRFNGEAARIEGNKLHLRNWGGGDREMVYVKN